MDENYSLLVPFLNQDPVYCHGVELGMQVIAPMLRKRRVVKGYFRTENEEQIRLTAGRLGYVLEEVSPWDDGPEDNGWVYMKMVRKEV